jgi:hydrogenase nickel incorporation protein HypB
MLLDKIDLLPYPKFGMHKCIAYAQQVHPAIQAFRVSTETGEGMAVWYRRLRDQGAGCEDFGASA